MRIALLGVLAVGLLAGCGLTGPDQSVILGVESLEAPATSTAGSPLTVTLTVTINMCQSFDHIQATSLASGAALTAWGMDASIGDKHVTCPTIIKTEPHSYQLKPTAQGEFQITVDRGRLSPLTTTVQVQ